ncbi:MAG: transporter [Crenarchaeota archaeon]|nr:transporter [Thermoproteota archaeon]
MQPVLTMILLFGFMGLGMLVRHTIGKYRLIDKAVHLFNMFIYYILLPAVYFDIFARRGIIVADLSIALVCLIYIFISFAVLFKIPTLKGEPEVRYGSIIISTFQNNVFLGFPVLLLLYGNIDAAATYSLITFIFNVLVPGLIGRKGENLLVKILKLPIIYGFAGGVLIHYGVPWIYPYLAPLLAPTHNMLSFGAIFILGYTIPLTMKYIFVYKPQFLTVAFWRFIASPIIHYSLLHVFPMPPLYQAEIMVLSIMPPAVFNTVIARIYGWKPEFTASATFVLTMVSMAIVVGLLLLGG